MAKRLKIFLLAVGLWLLPFGEQIAQAQEPDVFITSPEAGDKLTSPFKVQFGLGEDWGIAPAGTYKENTGHMHLIINAPPPQRGLVISADHLHLGGGQIETVLDLPPGNHTLQAVLGDGDHYPVGYSTVVTVEVVESK